MLHKNIILFQTEAKGRAQGEAGALEASARQRASAAWLIIQTCPGASLEKE